MIARLSHQCAAANPRIQSDVGCRSPTVSTAPSRCLAWGCCVRDCLPHRWGLRSLRLPFHRGRRERFVGLRLGPDFSPASLATYLSHLAVQCWAGLPVGSPWGRFQVEWGMIWSPMCVCVRLSGGPPRLSGRSVPPVGLLMHPLSLLMPECCQGVIAKESHHFDGQSLRYPSGVECQQAGCPECQKTGRPDSRNASPEARREQTGGFRDSSHPHS